MKNNKEYNYTLKFDPIQNKNGHVYLIDNHSGSEKAFVFTINDQDFEFRLQHTIHSSIADLIDIAASIHAADRLVPQDPKKKERYISVYLPIRNLNRVKSTSFKENLENLLGWTTGSFWTFYFQELESLERYSEIQGKLTQLWTEPVEEIALWSGPTYVISGFHFETMFQYI